MSCCIFQPVSITEKSGVTTITLSHGVLSDLCDNKLFGISLTTSIPNGDRCNIIKVTDGTDTKTLVKNNQHYRIDKLPCGCTMILCNKEDPDTVAVFCRFIPQSGRCR